MTNRALNIVSLLIASLFMCPANLCSSPNDSSTQYSMESVHKDRTMLIEKMENAAEMLTQEIEERAQRQYSRKMEFNRRFYERNINRKIKELEQEDTRLIRVILDFISGHPSDRYLPFALFKLSQLYLESANNKYKRDLESYYEMKDPPAEPPVKDLSYAIKPLERIRKDFPNFENIDSALYLLGYACLQSSLDRKAKDSFYELLSKRPSSIYVEEAFLRLAEFYFKNKNFKDAIRSYKEALSAKTENYTEKIVYKLAWAQYLEGNYSEALSGFSLLLNKNLDASKDPSLLKEFQRDAQMYIAFSLFRKKDLRNALDYLDTATDKPYAYSIGRNLGDIYFDRGFFKEAILIFKKLITDYPFRRNNPVVHKSLLSCLENMLDKQRLTTEWKTVISMYSPGSEWRLKNINASDENLTADELLEHSLYSLGTMADQMARESKNEAGLLSAADYYRALIEYFPSSEKAYHAQYYMADAYLNLNLLPEALSSFDAVLRNNYYNRYFIEAIYSEIVIYERMLEAQGGLPVPPKDSGKDDKREITGLVLSLFKTCDLFLEKSMDDERKPLVYYRSAQILDHYNHNKKAEERYNFIIENYPKTSYADDSFRKVINIHVALKNWPKVIEMCESYLEQPYLNDEKLKEDVYQVAAVARYKSAKEEIENKDPISTADYLRETSNRYKESEIVEKIIEDSFESYRSSKRHEDAISGMLELVKEHPKSGLAPKILMEIAGIHENMLAFDKASKYYRRTLSEYGKSAQAQQCLLQLAALNEGMGQYSKAADLYLSYLRRPEDESIKSEALLKAILNYSMDDDLRSILKLRPRAQKLFSRDREKLAMFYLTLAQRYEKRGYIDRFKSNLKTAEKILSKVRSPLKEVSDIFYELKLKELEPDLELFKGLSFSLPRDKFLKTFEKKALLLKKIEGRLMPIIKNAGIEYASCALLSLGKSYENFGTTVLDTKLPSSLTQDQIEEFKDQFKKISDPLIKKARSVYIKNLSESKKRTFFNDCLNSSALALANLIESESMTFTTGLDFKFKYKDDIFTFALIEDPDDFRDGNGALKGYLKRRYKEAVELAIRPAATRDDLKKAAGLFDLVYLSHKGFKEARFNKAVISEKLGNYDAARFIYSSFTGDSANDRLRMMSQVNLTKIDYDRGNWKGTLGTYRKLLDAYPEDVTLLSNMAFLLRRAGKLYESEQLSRTVLSLSDVDPRAYNNIALIYKEKGNKTLTETIFRKGLLHHPKNMLLLNNLAAFYIERGDIDNSRNTLARIRSINKYDETYSTNYTYLLLKSRNYDEGLSVARNYWDVHPKLSSANYLNLGLAYLSVEKRHEALLHINTNLKFAGPFRGEAQNLLSKITQRRPE